MADWLVASMASASVDSTETKSVAPKVLVSAELLVDSTVEHLAS